MNQLTIELDSRETCICLVSKTLVQELKHPFISVVEKNVVLSLVGEKYVRDGYIRISNFFASALGMKHGESVSWNPVEAVLTTSSPIVVAPATTDDWEVIEAQASFLESSILGQIRSVSLGMKFPIFTARGQKPVMLKVVGGLSENAWSSLTENSELSVEARTRREVDLSKKRKKYLALRVVDSGFPANETDLLHVGMIVNSADFTKTFGPEGGSLVTIRDRPEILTLVACDSRLVDPGVVLVSPLMRDVYGLTSGDRITIEQQSQETAKGLLTPTVLHIEWPREMKSNFSNSKLTGFFKKFIKSATCVIAPQGGFVAVPVDAKNIYAQIRFEPASWAPSSAAAYITGKTVDEMVIENSFSDPSILPVRSKPFLKYVPEPVACTVTPSGAPLPDRAIPLFEPVIENLTIFIENCFTRAKPDSAFVSSVLLTSANLATGRTTAVRQALARLSPPVPYVVVNCRTLSSPSRFRVEDVKNCISGLIRFGFESPPFVIVFDDIDELIPNGHLAESDAATAAPEYALRKSKRGRVIADHMQNLIADLKPNRSLVLVGTAVTDSPTLANIFVHSERLPVNLTEDDKTYLLPHSMRPANLGSLDGYSLSEIVEIRNTGVDNRELRRRLIAGDSKKSVSGKLFGLGGMNSQINQLKDAITLPLHFSALCRSKGGKSLVSTGAFVVGPPGCGKSALIDHVVKQVGLPVEIVRGPDLLDKYIGASEQGVRRVFHKAASIAPCLVVFDTIDALCPRRGSESTGVTDRVVNQMLCYLDGVEMLKGVFVIAVTSRPDMVDPALTRPGRLDMVVLCDIPTMADRIDIVKAVSKDFQVEMDDSSAADLASLFPANVTGADIRAAFVNAQIIANRTKIPILKDLLESCVVEIKASVSQREAAHYDRILAKYRGRGSSSTPSEPEIGTRVMLH